MSYYPGVDYYVDDDGVLHVEIDGDEIGSESECENLSEQAINDFLHNARHYSNSLLFMNYNTSYKKTDLILNINQISN